MRLSTSGARCVDKAHGHRGKASSGSATRIVNRNATGPLNLQKAAYKSGIKKPFKNPEDWVFASPFVAGRTPWYPWGVERRHLIPAGIRCGIGRIGWHTFRHTFRTSLMKRELR